MIFFIYEDDHNLGKLQNLRPVGACISIINLVVLDLIEGVRE